MISDVTFVVFHYPMADLLWVSCGYAWPTHIHQSTCEYNFLTHGATFCPISDCHSGSLAFILIHNFSPSAATWTRSPAAGASSLPPARRFPTP